MPGIIVALHVQPRAIYFDNRGKLQFLQRLGQLVREISSLSAEKLWRIASNPSKLSAHFARPVSLSPTRSLVKLFPEVGLPDAEDCRLELLRNHRFYEEVNSRLIEKRGRRTDFSGWYEFLFLAVRFAKPEVMFETGIFDGASSALILQAMHDNNKGILVSFDLPAKEVMPGSTNAMADGTLPPGCQPGWLVPDRLRSRYRQELGDSRHLLPKLFAEYPSIDIFFHDSLHTFEHQYFEYGLGWEHLPQGGLLLSDDIYWSSAFHKFCRQNSKTYTRVANVFGAVRK